MRKHEIEWNPNTSEWLCIVCRRTSDHASKRDAETELIQFDCLSSRALPEST